MPGRDAYKLDEQDMTTFLAWEMLNPRWERGEVPTHEEWERHLVLQQVIIILDHHPYCVPGNPSAELWNLYLNRGDQIILKYYQRFQLNTTTQQTWLERG